MAKPASSVTVTFRDEADVQQAVQSVREHEVEDDVRSRLGHRVAMSVDGPTVFLYAGTEDTARETNRVVHEVLAPQDLLDYTMDVARRLARTPAALLELVKDNLNAAEDEAARRRYLFAQEAENQAVSARLMRDRIRRATAG